MSDKTVIGADIGGTAIKFVIAAGGEGAVLQDEIPTDPADPRASLQHLADKVDGHLAGSRDTIAAIGLACAGIVSPFTGRLGRSPNLPGWEDRDLAELVNAAFPGRATAFANDVNAALYGEYRFGAGRGCRDLVMIALGTGVGGGLLISGRLHTGRHDGAGEIGHMMLDANGRTCTCGNRGCLEAYAGSVAILRRARELAEAADQAGSEFHARVCDPGTRCTTQTLYLLAEAGNAIAADLFAEVGWRLGQAVANLVNVFDPDRVIIGGGVAQAGDLILAPCRQVVAAAVLAEEARRTPVVPAELGPFAAALGVAALARETE